LKEQILSAVCVEHPHFRFFCTGAGEVPCAFCDMTSSPHTIGSFTPSATGAPLQPSERLSSMPEDAEDAAAAREVVEARLGLTANGRCARMDAANADIGLGWSLVVASAAERAAI